MKRIVILGAAESGAGAAVLAKKEGFDVFVSDMSVIKDKYKKMLDDHAIEWEEGKHSEEKILNADEIIKSPGIPDTAPMIRKIVEKGIHIISEIEFAGRYTDSKMICITGSNGKTTTTSLIYHIFKEAGYDAGLAGNIGNSLALQVAEDPHEYYIIELSSFQLDNMYDFRANIAILLNITPDHLDRYDNCMQNYVDAKMRIIQNQTDKDAFIYWNDDPIIKRELEKYDIKAVQYPFSELKEKGGEEPHRQAQHLQQPCRWHRLRHLGHKEGRDKAKSKRLPWSGTSTGEGGYCERRTLCERLEGYKRGRLLVCP